MTKLHLVTFMGLKMDIEEYVTECDDKCVTDWRLNGLRLNNTGMIDCQ